MNSCELGRSLAFIVIALFSHLLPVHDKLWGGLLPDPFEAVPPARPAQKWPRTSLPRFVQAKGVGALLPGSFTYFNVRIPGFKRLDSLQPFIIKKDDWLLRIELTKARGIGSLTYYGKVGLEAWKFVRLVGCHDPLISNLLFGNSKVALTNILNFFSQPWFTLIFHDKFLDFYTELCLDAYQILRDSPEEQKLVQDIIRDGLVMFLNAYKADFPGLSTIPPGRVTELAHWKSKEDESSHIGRHSKARKGPKTEKVLECGQTVDGLSSVDVVCSDGVKTSTGNIPFEVHKKELELAVERIVEEVIKADVATWAATDKKWLELAVKNIMELLVGESEEPEQVMKGLVERIVRDKEEPDLILKRLMEEIIKREGARGEAEVEMVVKQMMEKVAGRGEGDGRVVVELEVVEHKEAGACVQRAHLRLLVVAAEPSMGSGRARESWVKVLLRCSHGDGMNEGDEFVRVQFECPCSISGGASIAIT